MKQAADRRRKGVVGKMGRKIPVTPRKRERLPAMVNTILFTGFPLDLSAYAD